MPAHYVCGSPKKIDCFRSTFCRVREVYVDLSSEVIIFISLNDTIKIVDDPMKI